MTDQCIIGYSRKGVRAKMLTLINNVCGMLVLFSSLCQVYGGCDHWLPQSIQFIEITVAT